jgi:quinol monooxygenase YgiN
MWAGAGTMATAALGLLFKLPDLTVDLTPWVHWKTPIITNADFALSDSSQTLVTIEYDVEPEHQARFLQAIHKYERIRRRDGAYRWGIFQDLEHPNRYVETFLVDSWAEHLRQHERSTHADREVEERVRSLTRGIPTVHHLVQPATKP